MKKFISILLALLMAFSVTTVAFAEAGEAPADRPYSNSAFFEDGEYFLHYRTYEPDGKAKNQIMLVHGFCLSTASLEGVAEEYCAAGYRVVLVDAPNHGYSVRESSETVLRDREEVIHCLMEELGGTWIVGGHSMGGGIAINLACDYPEEVTGLVLYAPQTAIDSEGLIGKMSANILMQKMYDLILKLALKIPLMVKLLVAMSFTDSTYANSYDLTRITAPLSLEGTGAGMSIMASHARGNDFNALKALDIPCIIITAANDNIAGAANLDEIIANAPEGTQTFEFEDGGHMMMEYHPSQTAEITLPVIAECK